MMENGEIIKYLEGVLEYIKTRPIPGELVTEVHVGDPIDQDDSMGSYPVYLTVYDAVEDKDYKVILPYAYFAKR